MGGGCTAAVKQLFDWRSDHRYVGGVHRYACGTTWGCVVLAQSEAAALGQERLGSNHLLLALVADEGPVGQTLRESGLTAAEVRNAVGAAPGAEVAPPPEHTVRTSADAEAVLARTETEASAREHVEVEPGHLLLAAVADRTCLAYQLLVDLGADLDYIRDRVAEELPSRTVDGRWLEASSERYPRLSEAEVEQLGRDVSDWREAGKLLKTGNNALTTVQRGELERVREQTQTAWLRLSQHHSYLAWAEAKASADRGHDLSYAYMVATQALGEACLSFDWSVDGEFTRYATPRIADALEEHLGRGGNGQERNRRRES